MVYVLLQIGSNRKLFFLSLCHRVEKDCLAQIAIIDHSPFSGDKKTTCPCEIFSQGQAGTLQKIFQHLRCHLVCRSKATTLQNANTFLPDNGGCRQRILWHKPVPLCPQRSICPPRFLPLSTSGGSLEVRCAVLSPYQWFFILNTILALL